MTILYKQGNLISMLQNNEIQVLIHGCNAFCNMGAGIARHIKRAFPLAEQADNQTIRGSKAKIGSYSYAEVFSGAYVVNAYTQYSYGGMQDNFEYAVFTKLLQSIINDDKFKDKTIGIPLIGCGLAGGDIKKIIPTMVTELKNHNKDVYIVEIDEQTFLQHKLFIDETIKSIS